jgi:hypothetical protein
VVRILVKNFFILGTSSAFLKNGINFAVYRSYVPVTPYKHVLPNGTYFIEDG